MLPSFLFHETTKLYFATTNLTNITYKAYTSEFYFLTTERTELTEVVNIL